MTWQLQVFHLTFEPTGLSRSDGKCPDGLSLIPWERGRPLVWDVTVPDSLAVSYWSVALSGVGFVATFAKIKEDIEVLTSTALLLILSHCY